jgi:hypothetical protein
VTAAPDPFETAAYQWLEGERRLRDAPASERNVFERIVARIVADLRRRLGGRFQAQELADLYDRGTTWAMDIAATTAPDQPWAWDPRVVVDAAFARYLREAEDYAGGRRILEE